MRYRRYYLFPNPETSFFAADSHSSELYTLLGFVTDAILLNVLSFAKSFADVCPSCASDGTPKKSIKTSPLNKAIGSLPLKFAAADSIASTPSDRFNAASLCL